MKRIVCLLLALVLTTGALPLTTFAEGECSCTTACTEESRNAECPVCKDLDGEGVCPKTAPVTPGPTPTCNCTSKCTEGAMSSSCPVCSAEGATPEVCTYSPPVTYTVTYKDAEGSNSFITQTDVVNAGEMTPAFKGTLNREGFLFAGWDPEVVETVTADATYTATWAEARTITYKSGTEHNLFNDETHTAKDGDTTPAFSLGLNSFASWKIDSWSPAIDAMVNGDKTYTAQWAAKGNNKLVLDANGGTLKADKSSNELTFDAETANIPSTAEYFNAKENYTHKTTNYWNTEKDGTGISYNSGESSLFTAEHNEETVTLYAQWEPKTEDRPPVDKEEVKNLLEEDVVKIAVFGDSEVSFTEPAGSVLDSWEVKGNDVAGYTLEVTLSFNETLEGQCKAELNEHYTPTGETTKTDDWKFYPTADHPKSQTVTFSYGEGEWNAPSETTDGILATFYMNQYFTVTYTDGVDSVELFEDQTTSVAKGADTPQFTGTPARTGYGFDGWDREVAETVTADVTYTARWKANTYTVKFHANGGSGTMADQTLTYDVEKKLTKNAFTRKGHKFTGWADKEGTRSFEDEEEVKNLATGGEVSLTAQWIPSVERVDFSLSGYGYKKEITSAKVSPGKNLGVSYGTGYGQYGDNYGITNSQTGSALSNGTFADKKDYYLYVTFYVNQGYTHEDLTKDDVFLDGVPALSLTGKEDQAATQALDDEAGTELTAVFKLKTIYLIKASAGKNGAISPKDTVAVFQGDDVTFTITPDKGYVRSTLKVDDKKVTTAKTYTFKDVQASHTIRATFAKDSGNAKTGDDLSVLWALAAAILSAAALATVLIIAKKKKK